MKIVLTGGGSGGHFYPIISVAESIRNISKEMKLLDPEMYYIGPNAFDERALFDNGIIFKKNIAGKRRVYFSLKNFIDLFKIAYGTITALWKLFIIFPDVVFSKGAYGAFPVLVAARFFRIPVIIHDSDSVPGRVTLWSSKFAKKIAISFEEAATSFPAEKLALTGNPIRKELLEPAKSGAKEFLNLESSLPVVLILGGSQGSQKINEVILRLLPELVEKYQVIHQTGVDNIEFMKSMVGVSLKDKKFLSRYKPFGYLDILAMKMSAGAADIVVSRSGGGGIFEIANWGIPSILIPIPESISRDQSTNAFAYSSTGAAVVIQEENLSPHVLLAEIDRILSDKTIQDAMKKSAKAFARIDAADKIAKEIINIGLKHES